MPVPPRSDSGEVSMAANATLTLTLLAERIAALEAKMVAALQTEHDARIAEERSVAAALHKQAIEYERRLDVLNHAHEAAVIAQAATVPREMFDAYVRDHQAAKEASERSFTATLEKSDADIQRRLGLLEVSAIEIASRTSGRKGLQDFFVPSLPGLVAVVLGLIALIAVFNRPS